MTQDTDRAEPTDGLAEAMAHDALVYELSVALMRLDGNDGDPHQLLWTGGTMPEPWGDAWQRYESQANEVLNAIGDGSATELVRWAAEADAARQRPTVPAAEPAAWEYENGFGDKFLTHSDPGQWHPHDRAGFRNFRPLVYAPPAGERPAPAPSTAFDKKQMDAMVSRFLGWKLPPTFGPDCYITFDREKAKANSGWPLGTNLLTADEARAMLEYVLDVTFIPDWSMLKATQASLREHMAMVKELRSELEKKSPAGERPTVQPAAAPSGESVEALAHRMAWRYKQSSDPHHSDTYTFNRATLLDFAAALLTPRATQEAKEALRYRHLRRWWVASGDELLALMPEGIGCYETEAEMDDAIDAALRAASESQPTQPDYWPSAKVTIAGDTVTATLYAPGLPDGEYDLYLPDGRPPASGPGEQR